MKFVEEAEVNDTLDVPRWIEQDITWGELENIVQGGCASGAYMPAVTYYNAQQTMAEHGRAIFDYLEDAGVDPWELIREPPHYFPNGPRISLSSWENWACTILSTAVELWANQALTARSLW